MAPTSAVAPANDVAHTADLERDLVGVFLAIRDVVDSKTMRRSLPALLTAAQHDPLIAELHSDFVRDRREPIVGRLNDAVADGDLRPGTDADLVVDLLSGLLFYRQLMRRERTSDERVVATVAAVLDTARARP